MKLGRVAVEGPDGEIARFAARKIAKERPGGAASLTIDSVKWLGATDPSVVRDGLTFIDHIKGFHDKMGVTPNSGLLKVPGCFKGTPHTVIGHDADVPWPGFIARMDYELKLDYVIERRGHNVHPEDARSYLFGSRSSTTSAAATGRLSK